MIRAWASGVGILLAANGLWLAALVANRYSQALVFLLWISPAIAAFVSASLAPSSKLLVGLSMAIPAALLAGVINLVYQALGNAVDFPGARGGLLLVLLALGWSAVVSAAGGAAGYFLTRRRPAVPA